MTGGRAALGLGLLALSACVGAEQADVDIDFGGVCEALEHEVVETDLLGGAEIHTYAASDPSGAGWALITDATNQLALQRLPADADAPRIGLGLSGNLVDEIRLTPGPEVEEVWVTQAADSDLHLWHLVGDELVAEVDYSGAFPETSAGWEPRLLFVGRQPVLLAAPRSAASEGVSFLLAPLDTSLNIGMLWELSFDPECVDDGVSCVPAFYPTIRVLDVVDPDGKPTALLLYEFERHFEGITTRTTGVATLQLGLDAGTGAPQAIKREYYDLLWGHTNVDLRIDPGYIARDDAGYYIIAGVANEGNAAQEVQITELENDRLIRHDILEAYTEVVATLPKYTNSHFLQLTNQVGLGQAFENSWLAARLVGFTIDFEDVGGVDIDDDTEVFRAGHNQVLLRSPESSARGRIRCSEVDAPASE
ncbi:MAG: hypothetical protein KC486_04850 [Myxococcales bacterium]|nr:hypothetical protein [Myxococcales bacterium]